MTNLSLLRCLTVLCLAAVSSLSFAQSPQPFSAKVKFISGQRNFGGRLLFSEGKTRIEVSGNVQISGDHMPAPYLKRVRGSSPKSRLWIVLSPEWHTYNVENPCATPGLAGLTDCREEGSVEVDGRSCAKWRMMKPDWSEMVVYIDKATGVTMKLQLANGDVMELSEIQFGKQPDKLFKAKPPSAEQYNSNALQGPIFDYMRRPCAPQSCDY